MTNEVRIIARVADLPTDYNNRSVLLYESQVPAGFPSPAQNDRERRIDLHDHMVRDKEATFVVEVTGFSMIKAGITHGSLVLVDRSIQATSGRIIVAALYDGFQVKFYQEIENEKWLIPGNDEFKPEKMNESHGFYAWGSVTWILTNANLIFNLCTLSSIATTSTAAVSDPSSRIWKVSR